MKTNYTLVLLFFISLTTFSQNKRFSLEVNYPLAMSNGFENLSGIIDASINYRFAKSELFNYGASVTFDYLKGDLRFSNQDLNRNFFFYHVDGFTEMTIPSAEKLHPFAGAGFTYLDYDYQYLSGTNEFPTIKTRKEKDLGFNIKLGVQYDFTNSLFIQAYFHSIRTFNKSDFNNETIGVNYNQLKFGLGIRI
ncbi:outer membrane protein with beta-barrel domain [Mariniflexile fucanivorans]|uniref:Outer membrane protein with beta-barrel domain n=1 Tax=Mariniflexile fucanivorans TaxID=264023 RepID=A0A4R1RC52_9FLAO|nr:outer membrane beta-barrel protein [Mariniflexile fucanivorans]TCL63378.1 outer membrane protein with beta-barrel domain [Mariniflexile fucanivorans]